MQLFPLDYAIIFGFFGIVLFIGAYVSVTSSKNASAYFLSGRNIPWWLLGVSMVATTFSTDTPNLVTDLVRNRGVAGNWGWWCFLLTGMLTVFVYARLWRKSNVNTDLEFYELRYGGKPARFLRKFRAIYLGICFNVITMASVTLAAIKISEVMLGLAPWQTVIAAGTVTVIFSALGGFKGVVYSDFLLFFLAMAGAIGAAVHLVNLPEVGGLEAMLTHENVKGKLGMLPDLTDTKAVLTLLVIPLAVQWWSSWYPGSEPGGGGYVAQRMLAAKNGNHAIAATFFFNIMHYAIRPWPWILVALTSLVVYPDLQSILEAFPNVDSSKWGHDLAYPAMLTKLPTGLLGLVLASLLSAYMSTISTQLNWGASYLVFDFYKQQINPNASEKQMVRAGRLSTLLLMVLSALLALALQSAMGVFNLLLSFGAGTGLIFILRWFWWRINAWSEITAMFASGILAIVLETTPLKSFLFSPEYGIFPDWFELPFVVLVTTVVWLIATFITPPEKDSVLQQFCQKIRPGGPGWARVQVAKGEKTDLDEAKAKWNIPAALRSMMLGVLLVYTILFAAGYWIYGETFLATVLTLAALLLALGLSWSWNRSKKTLL